jgi:hypothetical protein
MSAQEIIAELPKLSRSELERVELRLQELLQSSPSPVEVSWGDALQALAGTVRGLPPDLAEQHDHYLHGVPKR